MDKADYSKKIDISSSSSSCGRKILRRRTHTRKAPSDSCFLDMAEARREIVNALHLHRSSSTPSGIKIHQLQAAGFMGNNVISSHQLVDSIPNIPEPIWSTTAPAVLCAAVPPVEVMEFEWFDNLSSSYSWWMGFLNSLDGNNGSNTPTSGLDDGSKGLMGQVLDRSKEDNKGGSDAIEDSPFTDDWLIFPAADEHDEKGSFL